MHIPVLTLLFAILPAALAQAYSNVTYLTAPALVTTPENTTTIQCWRLATPFITSSTPGVSGTEVATISNVGDLEYTILPARYDGGVHNAPVPQ